MAFTKLLLAAVQVLALWASGNAVSQAEDWWQFRGLNGGHTRSKQLPLEWGGFLQDPMWQTTIPGKGWSSPIVIGDRIWLTSSEQVALDEQAVAEKLADRPYVSKDFEAHASVKLFALELDASTGAILQRIDLFDHAGPNPIHWMNSYASPTPISDGEFIFCHFGGLGTACIAAASGEVLWKRQLKLDEITGSGASPVLWNDLLILACDGADQQYITALDKRDGHTQWKVDRPGIDVVDESKRRSFSTPIVVDSAGRTQLISMAAQWLISYDPATGQEWWRARVGKGFAAVPTPVFDRDRNRVIVCTGFMAPEMVAVDTTRRGDVTESAIVWRYGRQVPEISSPLIVGSEIYFASPKGIVTCLDSEMGTLIWQHRLGGNFAASPVGADGRIYFTSTGGITTVIQPGRSFAALATNELFGETYASLVVHQNTFLLRTNPTLYRLQ